MNRLSSDFLYHYKRDINVVKLILQHGFRYNMWDEKVLFRDSVQQNFVICFCDILKEQADSHRSCYGDIAIVLTKSWGIANGVSPMRYVHDNSPGAKANYIKMKNANRELHQKNFTSPDNYDYGMDYISFGLAQDNNLMSQPSIAQSIVADANLSSFFASFDTESKALEAALQKVGKYHQFKSYINTLANRLLELHNELEERDAFLRVYKDDFVCPASGDAITGKVLYDEREWRSVKFIGSPEPSALAEYKDAVKNRFLPPSYNLTFGSNDLVALLVNDQKQIDDIVDFLKANKTLVNEKEDIQKVKRFEDFQD